MQCSFLFVLIFRLPLILCFMSRADVHEIGGMVRVVFGLAGCKWSETLAHFLSTDSKNIFVIYQASQIGPNVSKYRRGVGRKLGEFFQFGTTGIGGLVYALYASWRVALVVLTAIPFVGLSAMATMVGLRIE